MWCSCGWHQVWQDGSCLFFPAQVSQDLVYAVLVFNASYDFDSPPASGNSESQAWIEPLWKSPKTASGRVYEELLL